MQILWEKVERIVPNYYGEHSAKVKNLAAAAEKSFQPDDLSPM